MSKTAVLLIAAWVGVAVLLTGTAGTPEGESIEAAKKDIEKTIQLYFDGIIKYDEQGLRKAFHPDAYLMTAKGDGPVDREPFQEWVLYTRGDAPDPTGRDNKIVFIDVTGNAAVVKTDLDWPHVHYIDYLSLLKTDGQWRIVNKIWHREEPRRRTAE